ncbi:Isonitrile hydratase [Penicillium rolfsii]|nr:Isonitrile hydratase [Penicillium rolfsii]
MSENSSRNKPLRIGVILYPGFQALDAFGPLDCINVLSRTESMTLSLLSSTLSPISTQSPDIPSTAGQSILPTHTYATAPPLDVLLVPGGRGSRGSSTPVTEAIAFIQTVYPSLKYLITVCTGSGLVARSGLLDGRRATTNKMAWREMSELRPEVEWVGKARWVVDGNIWTSSGVSAGIDVTLAWIGEVYGEEKAREIANWIEYSRHEDPEVDPFAELYGL